MSANRKTLDGKKPMQNVRFTHMDQLLDFLPDNELKLLTHLRRIIMECMPDCTEKMSYSVPYYKRHYNICFLWPASVTWGGVKQEGVRLGFTSGHLMQDEDNYLNKGNRKSVYWKDFQSTADIDADLLCTYFFEAIAIDNQRAKEKKKATL